MIDETNQPESRAEAAPGAGASSSERVGFCQECGRPLTREMLRRVGNGTFCEPCAAARQAPAGSRGWERVSTAGYGAATGVSTPPASSDEPNPLLAGALGFIPGVGAMYNGQYAKGALHLIVFVVLIVLEDNVNWVFGWLVAGWIFYQVFEAYHTARARRDNLPLPNPFGWNDIGDRVGFRNWNGPVSSQSQGAPSRPTAANWSGYVPPAPSPAEVYPPPPASDNPYLDSNPVPPVPPVSAAPPPTSAQVPYQPTYTGFVQPPLADPVPLSNTQRFPIGACWLIVLGIVFLLGNLLPEWRLSGRWLVPVLLGFLAIWMGIRRLESFRTVTALNAARPSIAGLLIGPSVMLTIAILLGLQNAHILPFRRSWPLLLVVWGAMLLTQRATDSLLQSGPSLGSSPIPPSSPAPSTNAGAGPLGL